MASSLYAKRYVNDLSNEMANGSCSGRPMPLDLFASKLGLILTEPDYEPELLQPLWGEAIASKRMDFVKELIRAGALVNGGPDGANSALEWAIQEGSLEACEILLQAGSDPNAQRPDKDAPLVQAMRARRPDIALTLLNFGCDPRGQSDSGVTYLHQAAHYADEATLAALIARGANPRAVALGSFTALSIAQDDGAEGCAQIIRAALEALDLAESLPARSAPSKPSAMAL